MALPAIRKLNIATVVPAAAKNFTSADRLAASASLSNWLERGGPQPEKYPRPKHRCPLLHLSDAFEISGSAGNITFVAKRNVEAGFIPYALACRLVLHPMSPMLDAGRRIAAAKLADQIRALRTGGSGILGKADDSARIDLIVHVALEILDGASSKWAPYIGSLPQLEHAAPPALWPYLEPSRAAATSLLRETSVGHQLACDAIELGTACVQGSNPDMHTCRAFLDAPKITPMPRFHSCSFPTEPLFGRGVGGGDGSVDGRAAINYSAGLEVHRGLAAASVTRGVTVASARHALLRAIGLVSTRFFGGIGMVPLLDLANGAPGSHEDKSIGVCNATIERTQLATSADKDAEVEPAVALQVTKRIAKGEELILSYGPLSSAEFLYKYGWTVSDARAAIAERRCFRRRYSFRRHCQCSLCRLG